MSQADRNYAHVSAAIDMMTVMLSAARP